MSDTLEPSGLQCTSPQDVQYWLPSRSPSMLSIYQKLLNNTPKRGIDHHPKAVKSGSHIYPTTRFFGMSQATETDTVRSHEGPHVVLRARTQLASLPTRRFSRLSFQQTPKKWPRIKARTHVML